MDVKTIITCEGKQCHMEAENAFCETCLNAMIEKESDLAYERGHNDGYSEGYEEGKSRASFND